MGFLLCSHCSNHSPSSKFLTWVRSVESFSFHLAFGTPQKFPIVSCHGKYLWVSPWIFRSCFYWRRVYPPFGSSHCFMPCSYPERLTPAEGSCNALWSEHPESPLCPRACSMPGFLSWSAKIGFWRACPETLQLEMQAHSIPPPPWQRTPLCPNQHFALWEMVSGFWVFDVPLFDW